MKTLRQNVLLSLWLPLLLLLPLLRGSHAAEPAATYQDPFAYCTAVGTIDAPDARYAGPAMPQAVAEGLRQAMGLPETAPLQPFLRNSYWRCMGGEVYACTVGANLPCLEKADLSRTPSQGMVSYCAENPDADNIPAYVTGRATVYAWRCQEGQPAIVRQVNEPDARGFLAAYWHRISP